MIDHLESLKNSNHPWAQFLYSRRKVILWMKDRMHYSDSVIAETLSIDEIQVRSIYMATQQVRSIYMAIEGKKEDESKSN